MLVVRLRLSKGGIFMIREVVVETKYGVTTIVVSPEGQIYVSRMGGDNIVIPASLGIWKMQLSHAEGNKVIRSGSGECGCYPFKLSKPRDEGYVENDTMHASSASELARNTCRFYADLFLPEEITRIVNFLVYHDRGEREDKTDDRPREGKFEEELVEFAKNIQYLPAGVQYELIRDFIIFENAGDERWEPRDREIMQFAKLCDKADAPLSALIYEAQGRKGSLLYKQKHFEALTEQDMSYIDEIETYDQVDVWFAHMIDKYNSYDHLKIFIDVIVEACKDVRGRSFFWLKKFLEKRNIFPETVLNTYGV